ncbi:MAG: glycine cleavage T C-terminal barrel domain-containing protein [Acidimicrobiales bacterium]
MSWTKGDFRGRAALDEERSRGVRRRLRGLAVEGRRPPRDHQRVVVDGQAVGEVTSGNFSPTLGHGIALAFLPPELDIGHEVAVDLRGTEVEARVVATPFVAPTPAPDGT